MPLVRSVPLEDAWQKLLADSLGRRVDAKPLALMVARQSARYRGEDVALAHADALAARALFWFPRDVHKFALPSHELLAAGALPDRPLRILDVGAGLGASSLGVVRALAPQRAVDHITAVDNDPQALALLKRIATAAAREGLLPAVPSLDTETRDVSAQGWDRHLGRYDLVLAGLSFVEMTRALGDEHTRAMALASHFEALLTHVVDDGAVVIIEPATREESRALQRAREVLLSRGVTVFAPCTHAGPCPMLVSERDWCHEDLADASLPAWLVPVAREAGLRWEGLTFSYLTLRRDGRTLASSLRREAQPALVRLLSPALATKGKTEAIVCGALGHGRSTARVMELARDAKRHTGPTLGDTARGDLLSVPAEALAEEGKTVRLTPGAWERHTPAE